MEVGFQVSIWQDYLTENILGYHVTVSLAKRNEDLKMDLRQPKQLELFLTRKKEVNITNRSWKHFS